jgi:hypothetical protein
MVIYAFDSCRPRSGGKIAFFDRPSGKKSREWKSPLANANDLRALPAQNDDFSLRGAKSPKSVTTSRAFRGTFRARESRRRTEIRSELTANFRRGVT